MSHAEFERYANDRVEDMLDAYAQSRLEPTGPVLARIRANVMAHAAASAAANRVLDTPTLAPATPRFAWLQAPLPRRALALGLAASLTLGTSAAVLAAPPGSPFYNARLVIETVLLPTDVDARLAAYESHLEERLKEAAAAAGAGDENALAAALAAYESDVAAALGAAGDNSELLAHLEAMLAKHTTVLASLEARVPAQASVEKAISSSERAIQKIKDKAAIGGSSGSSGGGGSGTGGSGSGGPGGSGGGSSGGSGGSGGSGSGGGATNAPPDSPPHGPPDKPGPP
jgi:hypothetical protein